MDGLADRRRQIADMRQVAAAAREAAQNMRMDEKVLLLRSARDLERQAQLMQKLLETTPTSVAARRLCCYARRRRSG
jgi:hypothetical protein